MEKTLRDKIDSYRNNRLQADDATLLGDRDVAREMVRQWQSAPEATSPEMHAEKRAMWEHIATYINMRKTESRLKFYRRFSAVAAMLVAILGSYLAFSPSDRSLTVYALSTGNQDKQVIVLEDGTRVTLGPNSRLEYPGEFGGKDRRVTLDGQAFFNVAADASRPFSVQIDGVDITALGTSFEVFAPTDNRYIEAILQTGKIRVDYPTGDKRASTVILPNHKLTYDCEQRSASVVTIDATKYSEWTSRFGQSFKNEQLQFVVPRLERWYGVHIELDAQLRAGNDRFTFKITDESLDHILGLMQKSAGLKWRKNECGDRYVIY